MKSFSTKSNSTPIYYKYFLYFLSHATEEDEELKFKHLSPQLYLGLSVTLSKISTSFFNSFYEMRRRQIFILVIFNDFILYKTICFLRETMWNKNVQIDRQIRQVSMRKIMMIMSYGKYLHSWKKIFYKKFFLLNLTILCARLKQARKEK